MKQRNRGKSQTCDKSPYCLVPWTVKVKLGTRYYVYQVWPSSFLWIRFWGLSNLGISHRKMVRPIQPCFAVLCMHVMIIPHPYQQFCHNGVSFYAIPSMQIESSALPHQKVCTKQYHPSVTSRIPHCKSLYHNEQKLAFRPISNCIGENSAEWFTINVTISASLLRHSNSKSRNIQHVWS
jgi:hypothetical protein